MQLKDSVFIVTGAGSGLGAAEQVAAFEKERDRLGLDRGGGGVFKFLENLFQGRGKSHRFKCCGHIYFSVARPAVDRRLAVSMSVG